MIDACSPLISKRVERLVPAGVAGRFESAQRTVGEARQERAGVVDPDLLDFAGQVVLALFDECFGHGSDRIDGAVQPQGGIDAVRQQVARNAAPRHLNVKTPQAFAALGQVLGNRPVLKKFGAIVKDPAQPALADQFLGQGNGGHAAIVVPDHVRHARLLDGFHDGL